MGAWDQAVFWQVLTSPLIVWAAWTTIWVATVSQVFGTLIGLAVAPMMMAKSRAPRFAAFVYLWIFRGTPLLAQILFFYAVLPQMGLRLSVIATGILALGVNEGARMAEVVRGGLLSVAPDQKEAAAALGLRPFKIFMLVVLPQALRAIVPPLGNNYSYMIKATSLLSVISLAELLRMSQQLAQSLARPAGSLFGSRNLLSRHRVARDDRATVDRAALVETLSRRNGCAARIGSGAILCRASRRAALPGAASGDDRAGGARADEDAGRQRARWMV